MQLETSINKRQCSAFGFCLPLPKNNNNNNNNGYLKPIHTVSKTNKNINLELEGHSGFLAKVSGDGEHMDTISCYYTCLWQLILDKLLDLIGCGT